MKQFRKKGVSFRMKNKKHISVTVTIMLFCNIFLVPAQAENILKILEGYGRDSTQTFETHEAHSEAAKLFNLILETDGKLAVSQAEQQLNSARSGLIRSYLCVMLADYSFVNDQYDGGLRYLKRAVDEHDPIRNDSYYRLVLSRAQRVIEESPGKNTEKKVTVLADFNPPAIKGDPLILENAGAAPMEEEKEIKSGSPEQVQAASIKEINFRIQVGAFSIQENALQIKSAFEERGYPVEIETRKGSSGTLYLIRVGAYSTYDEARRALTELKIKYPSEDGIVTRVERK